MYGISVKILINVWRNVKILVGRLAAATIAASCLLCYVRRHYYYNASKFLGDFNIDLTTTKRIVSY